MAATAQDIIAGRKVFFITPDVTLIPKSFCEDFLAEGYECYFVENDKIIPLSVKIDIIVSVFKDVILLFNVDADIPGISWPTFVKEINEKFKEQVPIGCLYTKRQAKNEQMKIERKYLYELDLVCGCIQLEYQKKLNFEIIEKVLFAFQATGRRKNIRAIGNNNCTFTFNHKMDSYSGIVKDISLSHFSFVLPAGKLELKEYEKIERINFIVKGCHFTSNAVLFMVRDIGNGDNLYVFMFLSSSGATGMDRELKQRFAPVLYQLMAENFNNLLERLYKSYVKRNLSNPSLPYTTRMKYSKDDEDFDDSDIMALLEEQGIGMNSEQSVIWKG